MTSASTSAGTGRTRDARQAQRGQGAAGESYIDGMKAAGIGDLDVDELVAMKVQGITPEYVREMRASRFQDRR